MGSSHHVFLAPRVQLNVHVAQTSMRLLDLRSPRSDAQCRGGDRQDAFNQTQRNFILLSAHWRIVSGVKSLLRHAVVNGMTRKGPSVFPEC